MQVRIEEATVILALSEVLADYRASRRISQRSALLYKKIFRRSQE